MITISDKNNWKDSGNNLCGWQSKMVSYERRGRRPSE